MSRMPRSRPRPRRKRRECERADAPCLASTSKRLRARSSACVADLVSPGMSRAEAELGETFPKLKQRNPLLVSILRRAEVTERKDELVPSWPHNWRIPDELWAKIQPLLPPRKPHPMALRQVTHRSSGGGGYPQSRADGTAGGVPALPCRPTRPSGAKVHPVGVSAPALDGSSDRDLRVGFPACEPTLLACAGYLWYPSARIGL
jgi:hypothetical protein